MVSLRISSTFLLLVAGFIASVFTGQVYAQKPASTRQDSFFYSQGKKIPVSVSTTNIGVLTEEIKNSADKSVGLLEKKNDLTFLKFLDPDKTIETYSLPKIFGRTELAKLAMKIEKKNDEEVKQAGIIIMPLDATVPFILTDEFIAQFKENVSRSEIDSFNKENKVKIIEENRFVKNQFLLRMTGDSRFEALTMANFYHESGKTVYAHPNFIHVTEYRSVLVPNDPLFSDQWHHQNTGQGSGTVDADVDTPLAWGITRGNVVIAVIDDGFDTTHPDLVPNLWTNPGEIPANGRDDDGNGFIDDINGIDFIDQTDNNGDGRPDGDGDPSAGPDDDHGTAVAGVAAAKGDNGIGVSGSCPDCRLMLIRSGNYDYYSDAKAFYYAREMGAQVITNSWGFPIKTPMMQNLIDAINDAAVNGRGGLGSVVLFAMNNRDRNDCTGASPDISSLPSVIAVSASSNLDRKVTESAFGNCMDVLAPTHRGYGGSVPFTGTLNIVTTDRRGGNGYNKTSPILSCPATPGEPVNEDYTYCFGGTSSATPLTAGIAGLILSVNNALTREQVQRLLQDTTDKLGDAVGSYSDATGFSTPASGNATHGYGRIDAFEAVRIAAPVTAGGKGGVDVFLRDNRLDWGNTEQPSSTLFGETRDLIPQGQSVDIKVDAPPYQPSPANSVEFEAFTHENAGSGALNKVYVRVRNRGPVTATAVTLKLHWAYAGAGLPALPADFWNVFPSDPSDITIWRSLGSRTVTVPYSGSSVANTGADAAQIVSFDFNGPPVPSGGPNEDPNLFCLFAVLDGAQDKTLAGSRPGIPEDLIPDQIIPQDNNITQRNIKVENATP